MTHVLVLALRYLRFNKIKTAILVFGVAVAVFLPLAVNLLVRDYQRELLARAGATPLVAGAPASRFDLVLHALYFRGKPAHDLTMAEVNAINSSGLAAGIPIIAKHAAQGVPIVGTSLEYFPFRRLTVACGAGLTQIGRLHPRSHSGGEAPPRTGRQAHERSGKRLRPGRLVSPEHARRGRPGSRRHGRRRRDLRRTSRPPGSSWA